MQRHEIRGHMQRHEIRGHNLAQKKKNGGFCITRQQTAYMHCEFAHMWQTLVHLPLKFSDLMENGLIVRNICSLDPLVASQECSLFRFHIVSHINIWQINVAD